MIESIHTLIAGALSGGESVGRFHIRASIFIVSCTDLAEKTWLL